MSQEYTTQSGRVSRPPKAFGASRPEDPERPYKPYVQRPKRTRAEFTLEEATGSDLDVSEEELRMPGALRGSRDDYAVRSERPVHPPWEEENFHTDEDAYSEKTEIGRPSDNSASAIIASNGGRPGLPAIVQLPSPKRQGSRVNDETTVATDDSLLMEVDNLVAAKGTSGREPEGSLRSPTWLTEAKMQFERDKADWEASREREAERRAQLDELRRRQPTYRNPGLSLLTTNIGNTVSPLRRYSINERGSPIYRHPLDRETPRHPTILVPGTPGSDATQPSQRSGRPTDPLAKVPDPSNPQARGPRNVKRSGQGFWDTLKKSMKPVQTWLADVSEAMAQPTRPDPATEKADPPVETDYEVDEEAAEFIRNYSTPKTKPVTLDENVPVKDVDSDVSMGDRIPAAAKGKSRDPTWVIPLVQSTPAVAPSVAPVVEPEATPIADPVVVPAIDPVAEPKKPVSILKHGSSEAAQERKDRERELERQLEKEKRRYLRTLAAKEELQLQLALRESEIEAQEALEKQKELEEALRRSKAEAYSRKEGESSRPAKKVEIAKEAKPLTDAMPVKERPKSNLTRAKEAATSKVGSDPLTDVLVARITARAKERTERLRREEEGRGRDPNPPQRTPSTLKRSQSMGSERSRGPIKTQSSGSERSRGRLDDQVTLSGSRRRSRSHSSTPSSSSSSLSSSPTTSSKDTSGEEQRKATKKERRGRKKDGKERRAAIKAIHINKPRQYNGEAIYDKYEAWMEEFANWRILHDLNEYGTMVAMSLVLTGTAAEWYNLNVRGHEKEWTLDVVSEEMFHDLFPDNYASIMRQTFEDAHQRENSLKKWHKYLAKLSKRVHFVTEHDLRRRFWMGSAPYLQEEWARIGLNPEDATTTVDEMLESGMRFERARGYKLAAEKRTPFNTRGLRDSTSKPRPNDYLYKDKPPMISRKEQNRQKKHESAQPETSKPKKNEGKTSDGGRKFERKKLTEEEMEQLRADDCCFQCGKHGHIARNCPQRREAVPPKKKGDKKSAMYNGSMQFVGTSRKSRTPVIRLGMMEIGEESEESDESDQSEGENLDDAWGEVARERETLQRAIIMSYLHTELAEVETPYEWQRNSPMRPYRFEFGYYRRGVIRIGDTWRGWYAFLREALLYEEGFSIRAWISQRDLTEPRTGIDPPPLPEDGHDLSETESEEEEDERSTSEDSTESEEEDGSTDPDDSDYGDMPALMSVSEDDSDEEGDDTSSVAPSDSEDPSAVPSDSEVPSADSNSDPDVDMDSPHVIGCNPITPAKPRAKPRARDPRRRKEKLWENIEDNSNVAKQDKRTIPHPIILTVYVNGRACRALLDSGAYSDFLSTTLVDNLGLKKKVLPTPITLQMAVQGSRSKINATTTVDFQYSTIKCEKTFDIVNIASYDLILGTTFIWQHKIVLGMNPTRIAIGSNEPLKIEGDEAHTVLGALAMDEEDYLEDVRDMLRKEAQELCEEAARSELPPFRAINHRIPLIDETKTYKFRPSKCPRALEPLWRAKSGEYLRSGRWRMTTGSNPIPILLIQKPRKDPNDPIKIRACFDKREQNANTRKLASPLPDQTEVLERVAARKYRTVIDGRDAYEQIRVVEEDVWKTLFNTPDGLMESLVLQQGDCNGPATYQSLMNYIFAGHIGVWMDVYLDDLIIYSDTLEDHIKHVRTALKILKKEKLFLNPKKMQFIAEELEVLGHRITDEGIKMDPHKVDSITKWPIPNCKELLASFIGAVGYLADGVRGIRIPMAVLNKITGSTKLWRWGPTEQRSFDLVKELVHEYREKTRVPLSYVKDAPMIWLVTDASMTGAAGHVCQGDDWKTAKPVAFWSGKFSSAEQAYPTHEQELLAIVESLKRFRHHLLGTKFTIVTDHEKLERFMKQKDLSRRQLRWLEVLCDFDFEITYSPGKLNTLADALSRIYSNDSDATERASSEYVTAEEGDDVNALGVGLFNAEPALWPSRPILVGNEVEAQLSAMNVLRPSARRNPERNRQKKINLREISDSEDSPEEVMEPNRGRGRPRQPVARPTTKPGEEVTDGESSAAPGSSGESDMASPIRTRAVHTNRWFNTSDEGESEIDAPELRKATRKENGRVVVERRADNHSTKAQKGKSFVMDPEDEGESEIDDSPPKKALVKEKDSRELAKNELMEAADELEKSQLPDPKGIRDATGVKLTDIINDIEIPGDLEGRYAEDKFFAKVLENPTHYTNFKVVGEKGKESIYLKESADSILCIPDVMIGSRRAREVVITHAHSILAHLGARKTLWYLRDNVWWKDMIKDITDYCASCEVCARTKATNQKPMGLLHPLKVPKRPWEQIGVDFVGPLPEARNRYGAFDQVMVVIDHLTSMVHIIPVKTTYRARQVAEVFYDTVYKLHGLPERIISDRDKIFTSTFWQNLHRLINVDIKMSSTYHPQTDGATERANRTMVQMIRQAIGEKDTRWLERLPSIEWAMNAARSETTGFSPFFLNYGHRPRPLLWNNSAKDSYPGVHAFAQKLKDAIMIAHDAILEKRVKQTRQANRGRRPSEVAVGDLVYLSTKNLKLPKGKSRKLVPKFIGPYRVTKELSAGTTYQLELPDELVSRGVNNAFHASLLRIHVPNCDTRFPGRQIPQLAAFGTADEGLEVEKIRTHSGRGDDALFELIWKNGEATWEPLSRVKGLEALVEYLEAMGVKRVENLPQGAGKPPNDDPEIYLGMLWSADDEPAAYKGGTSDSEKSPAQSPPPEATIDSLYSPCHRCHMSTSKKSSHVVTRVGKRRQDTPHPYQPTPPRIPTVPKFTDDLLDSLDIAVAVAKAGTTADVANSISKTVEKLSPARRKTVLRQVETDPSAFYRLINIPNIVERTAKSAERSAPKPKADQPTQALTSDVMKPLVPVFNELLNNSKISNTFLKELLTHQKAQSASTSTPTDPRKQPYLSNNVEYDDLWAQMGAVVKDDAEMADATNPVETAEAQTEDWLGEELPVTVDGVQATETELD